MDWNKDNVHDRLSLIFGHDRSKVIIHNERKAGSIYIIGFSIVDSDNDLISRILENIDEYNSFHFFDYYHPQITDPGAYVTLMKTVGNNLCYKMGNHGWESEINSITYERAKRYILKNIEYNKSPKQFNMFHLNFGEQRLINDLKEETINYSRLKDSGITIQGLKIYELNDSFLLIENESSFITEVYNILSKKFERKIYIGYYLYECNYIDLVNNYNTLTIDNSIDRTIKIKIKKYT